MLFDLGASGTAAPPPERSILAAEFAELLRHTRRPAATAANGHGDDHAVLDFGAAHRAKPAGANGKSAAPAAERRLTAGNRLTFEKELLGFYVSGHPLNAYAGLAEALDTFPAAELIHQPDRTEFRLCGIPGEITKKLSKKDNRPWVAFNLATRRSTVALNLFADAFAAYGPNLVENVPVVVLGNVIAGSDGARLNVKEVYPLDAAVPGFLHKVTWLLRPDHGETTGFLRQMRESINRQSGATRVDFAFVFDERAAPVAEASAALGWRVTPASFQELQAHPAVAGVRVEAKRLELKPDRRWGRK
jgi:DNA polymerase-3 subunit alpha